MPQDRITLEGMQFYAYHGYNPEEQVLGQPFRVDLEVEMDLEAAGRSDRVEDTVNYSHLHQTVRDVVEGPSRNLLETLAVTIAERVFARFPQVQGVRARVIKPKPPIRGSVMDAASVEVYRRRS